MPKRRDKRECKPIRLVIARGEGSFTLHDFVAQESTIAELKALICQKFNELYPDGVEPPLDWTSPKQMEIIKFKAKARGIEKDKLKLK